MNATLIPAVAAVTRTVVDAPAQPAKVMVELTVEAAAWLQLFMGKHNGYEGNNPVDGLYGKLESIPEVRKERDRQAPRFERVLADYVSSKTRGNYACFDVNGIR